ncbi:MAG TPA: DUF3536 domain-containing protein [Acidimicrobiales bacterium]|nr:DUF3536 domain-containing protein [Acidimicrobiales bacterium]
MTPVVVVHGHFYQPPRENPWTGEVPRQPGAAPFHDWNERVAAESYRPNGEAEILDDDARVVEVVNNYESLSFDVGPTLLAWLERHDPVTYRRILAGDRVGGGGMAQAFGHLILPLAHERDVRTQVRWGLADFAHRFGRPATGMWLPEAAVNDAVLGVLAEEGVAFTVLAPGQARRIRPLDGGDWVGVDAESLPRHRPYRWRHPARDDLGVDIVFYDGPLSHAVAFELSGLSSSQLLDRIVERTPDDGAVVLAADGESFGHHHVWTERLLAHALRVEAPGRGIHVATAGAVVAELRPTHEVEVGETSWSCAHGIERWRSDCGCSTGGGEGWRQEWRAPLRDALDLLRSHLDDVFDRRGGAVLHDPWAARDDYVGVDLGTSSVEDFLTRHATGDPVEALTLLEAQRDGMSMYTSCGWFFNDLAGIETVQVLRYAARVVDLLGELGEPAPVEEFLARLGRATSNDPAEGDGRAIWDRHVVPARVDARRVAGHLAVVQMLGGPAPAAGGSLAGFDIESHDGGVAAGEVWGQVVLRNHRTGRRTALDYRARHRGGLVVDGKVGADDFDITTLLPDTIDDVVAGLTA